jgi:[ribosomal protein S18]-alanine N-acetyltransferase
MRLEVVGATAAASLAAIHERSLEAAWSADDIAALIDAPGGFALAVSDERGPRGFLLGRAVAGEAEVLTLAVEPELRRQGLARALLEAAMGVARTAGAEAMFLEVAADNTAAISLYEDAQFRRVGARPGYYPRASGAIEALVMRRDLNSRAG